MTASAEPTKLLRPGLLEGVSVVLAGTPGDGATSAIGAALVELGAEVHECELICSGAPEADDALLEEALAGALGDPRGVQALVVDAAALFARESARGGDGTVAGQGPGGGQARALVAALEAAWRVTRAVANGAFIMGGAGGRIVYLAPPVARATPAAEHAQAARAGLENLARTLSIEWARYGITPVSIAPGPGTAVDELAGVVGYLLSPAGAYFSGTELDLRGPGAAARR